MSNEATKKGHLKLRRFYSPPSLVGQHFNDLTVRRQTTERQGGHVIYEVQCICGRLMRVRATRITNNIVTDCRQCWRQAGKLTNTLKFQKGK